MGSSRGSYRQRWREEPTDEEIYEDIRRSLEEDYEDEDYYQRGGSNNQRGGSGGSSSSNQRGGGSNNSFHIGKEEKMKKMAEAYEKIGNFFEILGENIEMYLKEDEPSGGRRR